MTVRLRKKIRLLISLTSGTEVCTTIESEEKRNKNLSNNKINPSVHKNEVNIPDCSEETSFTFEGDNYYKTASNEIKHKLEPIPEGKILRMMPHQEEIKTLNISLKRSKVPNPTKFITSLSHERLKTSNGWLYESKENARVKDLTDKVSAEEMFNEIYNPFTTSRQKSLTSTSAHSKMPDPLEERKVTKPSDKPSGSKLLRPNTDTLSAINLAKCEKIESKQEYLTRKVLPSKIQSLDQVRISTISKGIIQAEVQQEVSSGQMLRFPKKMRIAGTSSGTSQNINDGPTTSDYHTPRSNNSAEDLSEVLQKPELAVSKIQNPLLLTGTNSETEDPIKGPGRAHQEGFVYLRQNKKATVKQKSSFVSICIQFYGLLHLVMYHVLQTNSQFAFVFEACSRAFENGILVFVLFSNPNMNKVARKIFNIKEPGHDSF